MMNDGNFRSLICAIMGYGSYAGLEDAMAGTLRLREMRPLSSYRMGIVPWMTEVTA